MRIVWRREARDDLATLRAHVARDDPRAAERVGRAILIAVDRLTTLPYLGRLGRVANTRELVVAGTPYVIPYRIKGDEVQILRVYHGARRWPNRF